MTPMQLYAVLVLAITLLMALDLLFGMRKIRDLGRCDPIDAAAMPLVSVIIPACNEAATIEAGVTSVFAMGYAPLEVIVVNDRSTDETGLILEQLQERYPALVVHTLHELPPGWLGKSHALDYAARRARGDYLLFTDADILFDPSTLARAMGVVTAQRLDHLSLLFKNIAPGGLLNALILDGVFGLMLLLRPWKAKEPGSRRYMGVGAFNLVRASCYRAVDGHRTIAMHPIDDIMLGKRIKDAGFSQEYRLGCDLVQVAWYADVRELIAGVMKNGFALFQFRVAPVLIVLSLVAAVQLLPPWLMMMSRGLSFWLLGASLMLRVAMFTGGFTLLGMPRRYAVWSLVTPYVNGYILCRATLKTLREGGITWRGTHYPLAALKRATRKGRMRSPN